MPTQNSTAEIAEDLAACRWDGCECTEIMVDRFIPQLGWQAMCGGCGALGPAGSDEATARRFWNEGSPTTPKVAGNAEEQAPTPAAATPDEGEALAKRPEKTREETLFVPYVEQVEPGQFVVKVGTGGGTVLQLTDALPRRMATQHMRQIREQMFKAWQATPQAPPPLHNQKSIDRFWSNVDKTPGHGPNGDCWLWTGARSHGYGHAKFSGRDRRCTQVSWEIEHNEPFPAGKGACHSCGNPPCVNPAHLWVGYQLDNMQDAASKLRMQGQRATHCKHGHPRTPENTAPRSGRGTSRICLPCQAARKADQQEVADEH